MEDDYTIDNRHSQENGVEDLSGHTEVEYEFDRQRGVGNIGQSRFVDAKMDRVPSSLDHIAKVA